MQWVRKVQEGKGLPLTAAGRNRRRGVFISVGGNPRRYFEGAVRTVRSFFRLYEVDYWGELLCHGIELKGEIQEHQDALNEAADLGYRAVVQDWET